MYRHRNASASRTIERYIQETEKRIADAARNNPTGRHVIHTAAHTPGLATLAGRIERRIRRRERAHTALVVSAAVLAIGVTAAAAATLLTWED